jgi:hypothetical protein
MELDRTGRVAVGTGASKVSGVASMAVTELKQFEVREHPLAIDSRSGEVADDVREWLESKGL